MITWIQRYFQHHFKTIFAVLLGLIIISFVFITNTSGGLGSADRRMVDRPFFGFNLGLQSDQEKLMGDAGLSASLYFGPYANLNGDQLQNYAFQRAAALHLAQEWHIPAEATPQEIEARIREMRMFAGADGQFDPKAYQTFRDNLKTNPRAFSEADIARVIKDDIRANKVQELLSGPGYVLPAEIKLQLERADTSWTLAVASADYASFKPEITPADAELTQFFEQSGGRYNIPPRVVVSYLEFPAREYLTTINVTEPEVRAYYDANPSRFPKPADAAKPPAALTPKLTPATADDFAAVRTQVEAALKQERAAKLAVKAASDFSLALFESKARTNETIDAFLASKKLAAKTLPPFSRDNPPAELGSSPEIAAEAFRLSQDRVASDALPTPNGAVVLFWKETLPTVKPPFAQVREQVASDYKENERRKRFVALGKTLKSQIEARLKAGDTFEKAAAAASDAGLKLETKTLPAFTLRNRPQDIDYTVLGTLERLEKGGVSEMAMTADKGVIVYVVDKKAPDTTETNPQFAETRQQIASYNGRFAASAYINELVEQELKKSEPKAQ